MVVFEALGVFIVAIVLVGVITTGIIALNSAINAVSRGPRPKVVRQMKVKGIPRRHEHEWTRWNVIKELPIYTYPDPDMGRDLPDRVDGIIRRECVICGLPETKTVRGL